MRTAIIAGAVVVFLLDLIAPLGVAVAVPYVAVVLMALWLPDRSSSLGIAALVTVLSIVGFFFPRIEDAFFSVALQNRIISIVMIWATAAMGESLVRERELLRQARDFNEGLVETATSLILVVDHFGRIVHANSYTTLITGVPKPEMAGRPFLDSMIPAEFAGIAENLLQDCLLDNQSRSAQFPVHAAGSGLRQFSWSARSMRNALGEMTQVLFIGHDVTALVEAQQQVVASERLAAIGQTLATLSHESRNELNAMALGLDLLLVLNTDSEVEEVTRRILSSQNRLHRLFEELRTFAGPIVLERSLCNIEDVWHRAWLSLEPCWSARDATLNVEGALAGNDHQRGEFPCNLDTLRIEQVFRNLFENALAACTDPVRITIRQSVVACNGEEFLRIEVSDNGPGLTEDVRRRIFEPFFTTKPKGTGLGMAISRRIVAAHDGDLSVLTESKPGATFVCLLPPATHAEEPSVTPQVQALTPAALHQH